jgi:N6-adenosine-specific RNA methylase IME4
VPLLAGAVHESCQCAAENKTMTLPIVPKVGTAIKAADVARLESAVAARVSEIDDVDTLQEWRAQAAALEAYLRGKDLQRPMLGAQRRVEARLGQLEALGYHGNHGVNNKLVSEFRILARGFECLTSDDEWRKSRRALVSFLRQKLGLVPPAPPLPDGEGTFRCVVADPPWQLDTGPSAFNGTIEVGHDSLEYEQMSVADIAAMDIEKISAPDAHLYLWTTNKYIESAYEIARAWGFKPSVLLVWAKTPRGVGLGDAYRLTTEFCLYARRGSLREKQIIETTWFNWPRGRHSAKPEEFYQLVESMAHAPYLELFAREERGGDWTCWGNEIGLCLGSGLKSESAAA